MSAVARARRAPGCPSELALHQLATEELGGGDVVAAHARGCARCSAVVSRLRTIAVPAPDPEFWRAVVPPSRRRPRAWAAWLAGGVVALGALVLVAVPRPKPTSVATGDVRTKGSLALGLVVRRASGALDRVSSGGVVAPGDAIRFDVALAEAGYVVVLGLDARPSVSVYARTAQRTPAGQALLAETIVADDAPGTERVVALSCPAPPVLDDVRAAATHALAAAGGDPAKVGELAVPCAQASVVVSKAPR
ncbi:MAG TPA: hypothetical protein VHJ20_19100 [Polyangia bacterium]|nr:hypothetical protein [Polyangia bacterium]